MRTSPTLHTRQHTTVSTRCTPAGSTRRGSVGATRRISISTTLRGYAAGMVLPAPDGASHLSEMLTPPARAAPSLLASERRHARSVVPQRSVVLVVRSVASQLCAGGRR